MIHSLETLTPCKFNALIYATDGIGSNAKREWKRQRPLVTLNTTSARAGSWEEDCDR